MQRLAWVDDHAPVARGPNKGSRCAATFARPAYARCAPWRAFGFAAPRTPTSHRPCPEPRERRARVDERNHDQHRLGQPRRRLVDWRHPVHVDGPRCQPIPATTRQLRVLPLPTESMTSRCGSRAARHQDPSTAQQVAVYIDNSPPQIGAASDIEYDADTISFPVSDALSGVDPDSVDVEATNADGSTSKTSAARSTTAISSPTCPTTPTAATAGLRGQRADLAVTASPHVQRHPEPAAGSHLRRLRRSQLRWSARRAAATRPVRGQADRHRHRHHVHRQFRPAIGDGVHRVQLHGTGSRCSRRAGPPSPARSTCSSAPGSAATSRSPRPVTRPGHDQGGQTQARAPSVGAAAP